MMSKLSQWHTIFDLKRQTLMLAKGFNFFFFKVDRDTRVQCNVSSLLCNNKNKLRKKEKKR